MDIVALAFNLVLLVLVVWGLWEGAKRLGLFRAIVVPPEVARGNWELNGGIRQRMVDLKTNPRRNHYQPTLELELERSDS